MHVSRFKNFVRKITDRYILVDFVNIQKYNNVSLKVIFLLRRAVWQGRVRGIIKR